MKSFRKLVRKLRDEVAWIEDDARSLVVAMEVCESDRDRQVIAYWVGEVLDDIWHFQLAAIVLVVLALQELLS